MPGMKNHQPLCAGTIRHSQPGFALVVTLSLMILLTVIAVGLLTLSSIALRASTHAQAMADAQANARLGLMIAIGELQKSMGPDQRISAPSGILDSNPETADGDGLHSPHLTGVWNARNATSETLDKLNQTPPDYSRDKPNFRRWLVSNAIPEEVEALDFAQSGSMLDPVILLGSADPNNAARIKVKAGRVALNKGSYAWWVGDENCKASINSRDLLARETNPAIAELIANIATPGANGMKALSGYENFPSNSTTSDKLITRETLRILPQSGPHPAGLFHDLSPYSESVLANVTTGGLRKDLSLFLENNDINWLEGWGRAEGKTGFPAGPLGPNGQIALSLPNDYDVLCWKSLHHWYNMHRQTNSSGGITVAALDSSAALDPISNPGWNSGVTLPTPVMVRMQMLLSYSTKKSGNDWKYQFHRYPVITLWNPYNVKMSVKALNFWLSNLPLSHTVMLDGVQQKIAGQLLFNWTHSNRDVAGNNLGSQQGMLQLCMTSPVTIEPGGLVVLNADQALGTPAGAQWSVALHMTPANVNNAYAPFNNRAGMIFSPPEIIPASASDARITIGTADAEQEVIGSSYIHSTGINMQDTFGYRMEPIRVHPGHNATSEKWMFSGRVCWRREAANPNTTWIPPDNGDFPTSSVTALQDAPTPFLYLDVRLKTLDEIQLPNKTWLHNIPSHPFATATSSKKHSSRGVDAATTFFAHPYTYSFKQQVSSAGLFQNTPHFGSSNTTAGMSRITDREVPLVPLTSLAQLQNLPQYQIEALNWSGYHMQNHAIGNSCALPGLRSNQIKKESFPFYLGQYYHYQGGDMAGKQYKGGGESTWFNGDGYTIPHAKIAIIDRSYAANHLLFDDYFFSSMAPQNGKYYQSHGTSRGVRSVIDEFYDGTRDLPNASYRPYLPGGIVAGQAADSLVSSSGRVTSDAYQKAAAQLMVSGGFNINSTSVPAWTVMLANAHLKQPVIVDNAGNLKAESRDASFVVSRFTVPNGGAAGNSAGEADDKLRWQGYRELTATEIQQLAEAIVRQVKKRGPFRSLGEFINRRLADSSDESALYGALQAAIEDPKVDINKNYRDDKITSADIMDTNYDFPEAALGSRYQGTPAYISQADLLMTLAPIINARSDTFLIRSYGESLAPDGKKVLARAWCEAVVQRYPDYLNPEDTADAPVTTSLRPENQIFGRRFTLKSFRWLSPAEI